MIYLKFWLVLLLVALPVAAQDAGEPVFTLFSEEPIIAHGSADWDNRYTDPGAVLYHDEQFHMFRNAFPSWPGEVSIAYHTSPDGLNWTPVGDEPVIVGADLAYGDLTALASSAVVEDDGTWVLYYYTWENYQTTAKSAIGRATAPAPTGPWTPDETPVLLPGAAGAWDSLKVTMPRVLKTDNGYVMFYTGNSEVFTGGIGMATSLDGITWTKQDEPVLATVEENVIIHQPNVVATGDGYTMIYRRVKRGMAELGLYSATSPDGITWETGVEVWAKTSIPNSTGFWMTALVEADDRLYLYIEGGRGRFTDIYVATTTPV